MLSSDAWSAVGLFVYCVVATTAGCWAVDRFTGAKKALDLSKKWENRGNLSQIADEKDDEI